MMLRQVAYNAKLVAIGSGVYKLTPQLNELQIDDRLKKLFSRIAIIRQLNYRSQTSLEADLIKGAELWASVEPSLKEKIVSGVETYRKETKALYEETSSGHMGAAAIEADLKSLDPLERQANAFKAKVTDFIGQTQRYLVNLLSLVQSIEQRVTTAETSIDLTSAASFKLKEDEALILALKAKDVDKKIEGLLTFTNQRLIYEKVPYISPGASPKDQERLRAERQLLLERPFSSVANVTKGKVGFLEPFGLYVEFKQPGDPKLRLAVKAEVPMGSLAGASISERASAGGNLKERYADLAVQYFGTITSGHTDEELKTGVSDPVCERFKELARPYFPGDSFCFGRCKECGKVVSQPIKKWTMEGGPEMGIFDCPTCKKPFREVLNKGTSGANSELDSGKGIKF